MKISESIRKNWVLLLLTGAYLIIFLWGKEISGFLSKTEIQNLIGNAIYQGWLGLVDYLSAHVLFCLIPAFFIAGAVNSLLETRVILKYLGAKSKKWLAYFIASLSGFLVQVCSCTILPLFAGIWTRGAGLGVATTFLYAGPAVNLLALVLTGQKIGWDFAILRFFLSMLFAILIGLIMEFFSKNEKEKEDEFKMEIGDIDQLSGKRTFWFWGCLIAILVVGTAPISHNLRYTLIFPLIIIQLIMAFSWLPPKRRSAWWRETIKFMEQIIPLLLVGVFLAGTITALIPKEKFQQIAGKNTILANFFAVLFGALAYFPALVEVPIAQNFLKLGMSKGPLMAYLLADPVLSLQGLLIIRKLIGTKKMLTYVISIIILTTLAGFLYGVLAT